MAKSSPKFTSPKFTHTDGFNVTAVIGRVELGGDESTYHAAMKLIADNSINFGYDQEATYHFPGVSVTVKFAPENVDVDNYADMEG